MWLDFAQQFKLYVSLDFVYILFLKKENVSSEGFIEEASFVEGLHPASISVKALLRLGGSLSCE